MNALTTRFSSSSALYNVEKEEDVEPSMWGSSAGFGNLGKMGVPSFEVPSISNVSLHVLYTRNLRFTCSLQAHRFLENAHG